MKNIMTNWTVTRALYLVAGLFFVLIAANDRVWWMIPFGLYFVAMSLFKLGCAAGTCQVPQNKEVE